MDFLGLGFGEVLLVVVIALIVVGPEKIPELARGFGRMVRTFRQAASGFTTVLTKELDEVRKTTSEAVTTVTKELDEAQKTTADLTTTLTKELEEAQKTTSDITATMTRELDEAQKSTTDLAITLKKELGEAQKTTADLATTLTKELDEARKGLEPLSKVGSDVKPQDAAKARAAKPVGADQVAGPIDQKDISGKNE